MIRVGTCGFFLSAPRVLSQLQACEVQQGFHRPVPEPQAAAWKDQAPMGFAWTVKASMWITHPASSPTYRRGGVKVERNGMSRYGSFQTTPEVESGWEYTHRLADRLGARAVVFQTPASFLPSRTNVDNVYRFFEVHDPGDRVLAWEPRGPWPDHIVEKACEDLGIVHAVDPFEREPATTGTAYFRLHGSPPGAKRYYYTYTDADLARVTSLAREFDDAYILFDNETAVDDAIRLQEVLSVPGPT